MAPKGITFAPSSLKIGQWTQLHTHTHTHTQHSSFISLLFVLRNLKGRNRLWRVSVYGGEWLILISGRSAPRYKRQYPLNRRLCGSQSRSISNDSPVLSIVTIQTTKSRIPPFTPPLTLISWRQKQHFSKKNGKFLPDYMLSRSKRQ